VGSEKGKTKTEEYGWEPPVGRKKGPSTAKGKNSGQNGEKKDTAMVKIETKSHWSWTSEKNFRAYSLGNWEKSEGS